MKKIVLIFSVTIALIACKNDKKVVDEIVKPKQTVKKQVITEVKIPDYTTWGRVSVNLKKTENVYQGQNVFLLSRNLNSNSKSTYAHTRDISIDDSGKYRVSIILKKGNLNDFFGLRIMGVYPNRIDGVFNLNTGETKGIKETGGFTNGEANIEHLGDEWYKCSLTVNISAKKVKIILGPTTKEKEVNAWTVKTKEKSNSYLIPSSLLFERIIEQ